MSFEAQQVLVSEPSVFLHGHYTIGWHMPLSLPRPLRRNRQQRTQKVNPAYDNWRHIRAPDEERLERFSSG